MATKTLYHGELSKMGPVMVTVMSDVQASKYSKPGVPKPDWVSLEIGGVERTYNTENAACADFFREQKGRTFAIEAAGSREQAIINYLGDTLDGQPQAVPPAKPPPPAMPKLPPPATSAAPREPSNQKSLKVDLIAAKIIIGRSANLWGLSARALSHQLALLNADANTAWIAQSFAADAQATQAAVATIAIEAQKHGAGLSLPCGDSAHQQEMP